MKRTRSLRRALLVLTLLSGGCATAPAEGMGPAASPTAPAAATGQFAPVADHHLHLLSPAAAALFTPPFLEATDLPPELDELVRRRWQSWNDQPALERLYTPDALYYTGNTAGWARGNAAAAGYVRWTISDTPYRFVPVSFSQQDRSAQVAGYAVENDGSERIFGTFLLSLVRDGGADWRIAAENYLYRGAVEFASPRTAEQAVVEMDAAGVRRAAVLSGAYYFDSVRPEPVPDALGKVRAENDWTAAQVALFPDRLVAFCSFNATNPYALAELERCAKSGGFKGIKLHFNAAQLQFGDAAELANVRRVIAAANRHRMPLVIHVRPGNTYGRAEAEAFLRELVTAAPDVTVQVAHLWGGESYSAEALDVFAEAVAADRPGTKNLYFDISGVTHYGPAEKMDEIARAIRKIGVDRILFGSDAPIEETWRALRAGLPLTEAEFRTIAGNVAPYLR